MFTVYLPLFIIIVVLIFPFYWMALTAIKPDEQLLDIETYNPFFVIGPTLQAHQQAAVRVAYPLWLWNTMYRVDRGDRPLALRQRARGLCHRAPPLTRARSGSARLIFLAYLVPPSILFIPLWRRSSRPTACSTAPMALILTYPTILIPFSTWLLMGYFKTIPYELEECALIDGASRWQILTKIILPLAVPGLISAGIFSLTLCWNEFIYALTFIPRRRTRPCRSRSSTSSWMATSTAGAR